MIRGGVYSECKEGYIGALCQVCDNKGSIKYSKQRLYNCVPCADLSSFVIRICFLSIFIIGFYIFIIW